MPRNAGKYLSREKERNSWDEEIFQAKKEVRELVRDRKNSSKDGRRTPFVPMKGNWTTYVME